MRRMILSIVALLFVTLASSQQRKAPAPMYRDPITDGAADPVVFWNNVEKCWWMLYTQRRANQESPDVAYCYGNPIGIAQSDDNGASWYYRGTLDLVFERGHNTFWAPEVVYDKGVYHLFTAYIKGVHNHWSGRARLVHFTSKNLWDWKYRGRVDVGSENAIDITLFKKPDGTWRAWYKDETAGSHTFFSDSRDLFHWSKGQEAIGGVSCEGAKVFRFHDYYWMITDEWHGFRLYRSDDLNTWERHGLLVMWWLSAKKPTLFTSRIPIVLRTERSIWMNWGGTVMPRGCLSYNVANYCTRMAHWYAGTAMISISSYPICS